MSSKYIILYMQDNDYWEIDVPQKLDLIFDAQILRWFLQNFIYG